MSWRRTSRAQWRNRKIGRLRERDGDLCWICGEALDFAMRFHRRDKRTETDLYRYHHVTIDHVVPLGDGGGWGDGNLRLAHKRCNGTRGSRPAAHYEDRREKKR